MKIHLAEQERDRDASPHRCDGAEGGCVLATAQGSFAVRSDETRIGSGADCDVRLCAAGVEPDHAALVRRDGQYFLVDRSSSRETRYDGLQLSSARLQAGDVIVFGDQTFGVQSEEDGWALVGRGERFVIGHGDEVGRLTSCAVTLDSASISRQHARFSVEGGELVVSDLGSSNGTRTGDRRLGEIPLQLGDRVQIGPVELELRAREAAPAVQIFQLLVGERPHLLTEGVHRIGRSPDCEIWLDDEAVSRYHAELIVTPEGAMLKDLGSSNGTRVDANRVSGSVPLEDGSSIEVARHRLCVRSRELPPLPEGTVQLDLDEWDKTRVLDAEDVDRLCAEMGAGAAIPAREVESGNRRADESTNEGRDEPSEEERARLLLGVGAGEERSETERRFRSLCSEYQLRLQNAPTPRLRASYEQKLAALRAARDCLIPEDTVSRLPTARPLELRSDDGSADGTLEGAQRAGADPIDLEPREERAKEPDPAAVETATGTGDAAVTGWRRIPPATLWMAAAAVVMAVANAGVASLFFSTHREEAALSARRDALVAGIDEATRRNEEVAIELARLEPAIGPLLENGDFKFCNLSEFDVQITWLAVATLPSGGDSMELWDTSEVGYEPFDVSSGSAWRGEVVRGESTLWGGEQLFFAATVWDGVDEVLHGGSAYELGGDCFKLDLD